MSDAAATVVLQRDTLRLEDAGDGVVVLTLDAAPANEISTTMLAALEDVLAYAAQHPPRAMVITSARSNAFSARPPPPEQGRGRHLQLAAAGTV